MRLKWVGKPAVSAITHTPASGRVPFRTTPPMLEASTSTAATGARHAVALRPAATIAPAQTHVITWLVTTVLMPPSSHLPNRADASMTPISNGDAL